MTISNTNRSVTAQGNGATTEWPFTFNIPTAAGVNVVTTVIATGVQTVIDPADYTVTGLGTDSSGEIVYPTVASGNPPLTSATEITIFRDVPKTQTVNIGNQTRYDAEVVEAVWDKLTMMAQDLSGDAGLNLHYPTGDTATTELPASAARASKVIAFDISGNATVSSLTISAIESGSVDAAASAAAALVSENAAAADVILTNADVVTTGISETNAAASAAAAEAAAAGIKWKNSAKAATTANITLSGGQTIDTIVLVADDLCLVQFQTAPAENGLYVVSAGAWVRSAQMNTWLQVPGAATAVEEGAIWADLQRICTSDQGGTIDVTAITWGPIGGDVTAASTTTFTNKTIDADAVGNVVSNIDIGNAIAASQAEAEAGTDNTKLVTALRVAQAIAALSAGGGWQFVSSATASTSADISFAGFEAGFDYHITYEDVLPDSSAGLLTMLLGVTGPTYRTTNYRSQTAFMYGAGTSLGVANTITGFDFTQAAVGTHGNTVNSDELLGSITILNPNSATITTVDGTIKYGDAGADTFTGQIMGTHDVAEAITAVRFKYAGKNILKGNFKLYKRANA